MGLVDAKEMLRSSGVQDVGLLASGGVYAISSSMQYM